MLLLVYFYYAITSWFIKRFDLRVIFILIESGLDFGWISKLLQSIAFFPLFHVTK